MVKLTGYVDELADDYIYLRLSEPHDEEQIVYLGDFPRALFSHLEPVLLGLVVDVEVEDGKVTISDRPLTPEQIKEAEESAKRFAELIKEMTIR